MKEKYINFSLFCIFILWSLCGFANTQTTFYSTIQPLNSQEQETAKKYTWHQGCPVALQDLAVVTVSYFGFDDKTHQGSLIVNKNIAPEVVRIFAELYQQKFPIQKIMPAENYQGDDAKIMADNDTSAFSCRAITGKTNVFSLHSYGVAIDINPLINPYVKNDLVLPPAGKAYLNRALAVKGMIQKDSPIYSIFTKFGWHWGGDWQSLKDYQHFEKSIPPASQ